MLLKITRTTPIYAPTAHNGVFVQWTVTEVPAASDLRFTLERGEGPTGPFQLVASGLPDYHYFDQHLESTTNAYEAHGHLSLQRHVYYRVVAAAGSTVVTAVAEVGDQLPTRQRLLRKKIQRDIAVAFRVGNGVPLAILKRRHWGCRCTRCFDKLTKSVTNSKCTSCFGTGFVDGYHPAVKVSAKKGTMNVQTQVAPQGKVEINQIDLTVLDYPLIAVDDIVVELRTDRRYVVKHVTRTELRGVPVHQKLVMSELARDSIEYSVQVGSGATPTYY